MLDYLANYDYIFRTDRHYNENYGHEGLKGVNYAVPYYSYILPNKERIKTCIDISSGRGGFLSLIKDLGFNIVSTDLKKFNNLDLPFIRCDLSNKTDVDSLKSNHYDLLTCIDVLEHIEKQYIDYVLQVFAEMSDVCLLIIANHEDFQYGIKLHLIVEELEYWTSCVSRYFTIDKIETLKDGLIYYFECSRKI